MEVVVLQTSSSQLQRWEGRGGAHPRAFSLLSPMGQGIFPQEACRTLKSTGMPRTQHCCTMWHELHRRELQDRRQTTLKQRRHVPALEAGILSPSALAGRTGRNWGLTWTGATLEAGWGWAGQGPCPTPPHCMGIPDLPLKRIPDLPLGERDTALAWEEGHFLPGWWARHFSHFLHLGFGRQKQQLGT